VVNVGAVKEYAQCLGGSDRRRSLSGRQKKGQEAKERKKIALGRLAHTKKKRKTGTVLLRWMGDCLNTRKLDYSISPFGIIEPVDASEREREDHRKPEATRGNVPSCHKARDTKKKL
jgi:hypothetical protein